MLYLRVYLVLHLLPLSDIIHNVKIRTGIDIVSRSSFTLSLESGGQSFLDRCFHETERENSDILHLTGVFAAKEAVIKALSMDPGSWLDIRIVYESNGRPKVELIEERIDIDSLDISISHDGDYAVAACSAVIL